MLDAFLSILAALTDTLLVTLLVLIGFSNLISLSAKMLYVGVGQYVFYAFSFLGVIVHELSHFFLCIIFRHKVNSLVLFEIDPTNNRLGYVEHSYDTGSIYQLVGCFFIGVAPLFGGILSLYLITFFLLGEDFAHFLLQSSDYFDAVSGAISFVDSIIVFLKELTLNLWQHLINSPSQFLLWLFIAGSISANMYPSKSDFQNSTVGIIAITIILFGLSFIAKTYIVELIYSAKTLINTWLVLFLFASLVTLLYLFLFWSFVFSKKLICLLITFVVL